MNSIGARGLLLAVLVASSGCGGDSRESDRSSGEPSRIPVDVLADTGWGGRLRVQPPPLQSRPHDSVRADVWLAQVAPTRGARVEPPLPDPEPAAPDFDLPRPPPLEVDPGLKPPILRSSSPLVVPRGVGRASVELDVRVGEDGEVSDALWAGGSDDSTLVVAAIRCALEMRFFPALQAGRPVAVWCRQRFDFSGR